MKRSFYSITDMNNALYVPLHNHTRSDSYLYYVLEAALKTH